MMIKTFFYYIFKIKMYLLKQRIKIINNKEKDNLSIKLTFSYLNFESH